MKTILLVEDDPFLIDIYKTKLNESGYTIEVAKDGKEALLKMKELHPDLLILDIVIPNVDGWKVLKLIRKDKELSNVKIIILSNLGQKDEVEKAMKLGAERYLIKAHFTPSEVLQEVKKVLEL